ncbi:hypothetical protein [Streptomyces sp. NBC_00120]|nr:hypothetical protein [Streptomyces sp. NBC_00120]MCX5320294.1 hypothetical protein [Streptomyces sp. NBC_00120]
MLGDDNPLQTRSLLSDEYRLLARDLGFAHSRSRPPTGPPPRPG